MFAYKKTGEIERNSNLLLNPTLLKSLWILITIFCRGKITNYGV